MEQFCQRDLPYLDQQVDVIRHYAPGQETIPLTIEAEQIVLHHVRDLRIPKRTIPESSIRIRLEFSYPLPLILDSADILPLVTPAGWKGVREPVSDKLENSGKIKMRQAAAGTPPGEAEITFSIGRNGVPAPFLGNELGDGAFHAASRAVAAMMRHRCPTPQPFIDRENWGASRSAGGPPASAERSNDTEEVHHAFGRGSAGGCSGNSRRRAACAPGLMIEQEFLAAQHGPIDVLQNGTLIGGGRIGEKPGKPRPFAGRRRSGKCRQIGLLNHILR